MTEKRYSTEFNEKSEMMQYVDNYRGEPNRWAIWNHGETVNLLNKQHETIMRLESEVFKLEQIIKTGKMPVVNNEVFILIAKELYYLITHKGSSDLEEIVKFKKRIKKLEDME